MNLSFLLNQRDTKQITSKRRSINTRSISINTSTSIDKYYSWSMCIVSMKLKLSPVSFADVLFNVFMFMTSCTPHLVVNSCFHTPINEPASLLMGYRLYKLFVIENFYYFSALKPVNHNETLVGALRD